METTLQTLCSGDPAERIAAWKAVLERVDEGFESQDACDQWWRSIMHDSESLPPTRIRATAVQQIMQIASDAGLALDDDFNVVPGATNLSEEQLADRIAAIETPEDCNILATELFGYDDNCEGSPHECFVAGWINAGDEVQDGKLKVSDAERFIAICLADYAAMYPDYYAVRTARIQQQVNAARMAATAIQRAAVEQRRSNGQATPTATPICSDGISLRQFKQWRKAIYCWTVVQPDEQDGVYVKVAKHQVLVAIGAKHLPDSTLINAEIRDDALYIN